MSAPLVVNTADGTVWTRRGALRDGEALYAMAGVSDCPELVMATLADLAEHVIVGAADVLPVPVGTAPQALSAERLDEVDGRAAHLYEYGSDVAVDEWNRLAGSDVPALVAEVRRLWAERHDRNEWVDDAAQELERRRDRIAELEALTPARHQTCRVCGAGYVYGEPCSSCAFKARMAAETQARVHRPYRLGHDLPPLGGQL